jgi:hypothetical protein
MKRLLTALLLAPLCGAFLLGPAQAQKTKAQLTTEVGTTFPDNTSGQITPSGVRAFQNDMINSIMPTAPVGNNNFASFDGTTGLLKDSGISSSSQFVSNANIIPGAANTMKGSLDGATTSDIAIASCSVAYRFTQWISGTGWQCGISPVLPTRAVAASLDLSAFTTVTTQGYAAGGDGGGATFKNRSSSPFYDSFVTSLTITNAGSGCTNGTYIGVYYGGGTGEGLIGVVTVAGGIVTNATVTTPGNQYTVGDTLNQNGFFTCATTNPVITVAAVSAPLGSFTDAAGNHWQIMPNGGNTASVLQFGAKCDWHHTAGDAGATDDTTAIQAALNYGYGGGGKAVQGYVGAGGVAGMRITLPTGYCMSSELQVPCYVTVYGPGPWSGGFKVRDNLAASSHFITVGDSTTHQACFGAGLYDINIFPGSGAANAETYMIYTNNVQQHTFLGRMTISGGQRGAVYIQDGWGGAAMLGMEQIEAGSSQTTTPVIRLAYSTAITSLRNVIVENGGTFCHSPVVCLGVSIDYGYVNVDTFHSEGISRPIYIKNPGAQGISTYRNITCGAGTAACVTRDVAATANLAKIGAALGNTATLDNAGALTAGNIVADVVF